MIYELFLEGELADIRQDLGIQLNFNIDDISKYGSRDTSFSKTVILPGTARNNRLLGFVGELGSFNSFARLSPNINDNFNAAQTTRAEVRANGLLLLKGVFRLTGIVKDRDFIEYEGSLFGELGGFIAAIGGRRLQDLTYPIDYDHIYNKTRITDSWANIPTYGYYYPLIDHGTYSTPAVNGSRAKIDYDIRTFRPAVYVWDYIDRIFNESGFTYESTFFATDFFRRLIIPSNLREVQGLFSDLYSVRDSDVVYLQTTTSITTLIYPFSTGSVRLNRAFTGTGDPNITYDGSNTNVNITVKAVLYLLAFGSFVPASAIFRVVKNGTSIYTFQTGLVFSRTFTINKSITTSLNDNDTLSIELTYDNTNGQFDDSYLQVTTFDVNSTVPILTAANPGDQIYIKDQVPRNIFQTDFFSWILKMFNLYVTEDKLRPNHLVIEPYKDYYNLNDVVDWTDKVARDKPWQIKPMGMLNGRLFEYKYKDDNDYYNEKYKKKYNLPYGSNLFDSGFQFAKNKQTIEVGFSPTVSVQYQGTDKVVPAIYKLSSGNSVQQEERMPYNIRILLVKQITGVDQWFIKDGTSNIGPGLTRYGYAGHFNDPVNGTIDINFGASEEIYFTSEFYPSDNLFNTYWSGYIAEIADKDSKLLTCHVYLTELDIEQLDFSKPVFIDGSLWRINKIMDFDASAGELTKVELLKVINNG